MGAAEYPDHCHNNRNRPRDIRSMVGAVFGDGAMNFTWAIDHQNAIAVAIGGFLILLIVALMVSTYNSTIVPLNNAVGGLP